MMNDEEIWLYGSQARGDADELSDTDVLVVTDSVDAHGVMIPGIAKPSVSQYSWDEIEAMHAYGSLFLVHIAQEGRKLRPSGVTTTRLEQLLETLGPFRRASYDLDSFRFAVEDATDSISDAGWLDLEFQVLGTVARHAAILGCYCAGEPCFGRERPFIELERRGFLTEVSSQRLARLATSFRYTPLGSQSWDTLESEAHEWLTDLHQLMAKLEELVDRYESTLFTIA